MTGHPKTLVAAHPGNTNAVKSGIYSESGRVLAPRAQEIRDALMELPHVGGVDVLAAEEIGSILAALEAIDQDLTKAGSRSRRMLLEHKARLGRELRAWLREFGGTPRARVEWAESVMRGRLAEEIRRRRDEKGGTR